MNGRGRREDDRLLRGAGSYTADHFPEGMLHAAFLRSPHAHARVESMDVSTALSQPDVVAVYTCADLDAGGVTDLPSALTLSRDDGSPAARTPRPILARGVARHAGEPIAIVVARSLHAAMDAIEAIAVDYAPLPSATDCATARRPDSVAIWPEAADNVAYLWRGGDRKAVDAVISGAARSVRASYSVSRVAANPMEGRAIVASPDGDGLHVLAATQSPFALRDGLAARLGIEPSRIRVVAGDVGGAFGLKADIFREDVAVCWAARRLGQPVRWAAERTETFLADDQARDVQIRATLALDEGGIFQALLVEYDVNVGAYVSHRSLGPITNIGGIAGVYRTPLVAAEVRGVLTNTVPTAPYRGAGRPDATYAIERIIDLAAREIGVDPIDLRRRNLVGPEAMPFRTGFLFEYDCGDFPANMAAAGRLADLDGFPARRAEAARRGRLRGLGVCNPIEVAGGPYGKVLPDQARIEIRPDGKIHVFTGAMSVGQGLETAWTDLVAARLGLAAESIVYHQGDTGTLPAGRGSGGSAGLCVSGTAAHAATLDAIGNGRALAAELLEAAVADIEYSAGRYRVAGTDHAVTLASVAAKAATRDPRGLVGEARFQPPSVTFPNGCHICEVEVDPDTGTVETISYAVVEDIGRVLNPQLAHGQIHGGIAQGLGQAMLEQIRFDGETGQLLTGSFMDYAMPRAGDMPRIAIETREVPTRVNPLGAKGVGEAGTVGSLAAAVNAVCDALSPLGVHHIDMPLTPERVWRAIQAASRR